MAGKMKLDYLEVIKEAIKKNRDSDCGFKTECAANGVHYFALYIQLMRLYEKFTKQNIILLFINKSAPCTQKPLLFEFFNNTNIKRTLRFHYLYFLFYFSSFSILIPDTYADYIEVDTC